jgi:hypothetical protein
MLRAPDVTLRLRYCPGEVFVVMRGGGGGGEGERRVLRYCPGECLRVASGVSKRCSSLGIWGMARGDSSPATQVVKGQIYAQGAYSHDLRNGGAINPTIIYITHLRNTAHLLI